jgi:hypothetical protein
MSHDTLPEDPHDDTDEPLPVNGIGNARHVEFINNDMALTLTSSGMVALLFQNDDQQEMVFLLGQGPNVLKGMKKSVENLLAHVH